MALRNGEFTPTDRCIVLDFFMRHGIVNSESEENYVEIVSRLRRMHDFPTA